MRSRWNLPIYVAYILLSLTVLGFIVVQAGFITLPGSHPYTVTAMFTDAADILNNNEVYMNGTRIGHVNDVNVSNGLAKVQLVVDDAQALPLHTDASAEVRKKNLLGETYIDLQRGSADAMRSGGTIPASHTVPITEIDQVLAIFDPETVQRVQLLINALGNATTNNGRNLNNEATSADQLVTALNGPAAELSVRQQQVNAIVLELQRLYAVLAQQRDQVKQEFVTWNDVMAQLANQESGIAGIVQQADTLLQNLDALVSSTSPSGQPRAQEISALLQELGNQSSDGAVANLQAFLGAANSIIADIAPYRQYVNDVFPDLQSSFADTVDNNGVMQHVWSVFSVNCPTPNTCNGTAQPASGASSAPSSTWAAMGAGARR